MNRKQRRAQQASVIVDPKDHQKALILKIFHLGNTQMKNNDNVEAVKTFQSILGHSTKPGPIYHNLAVCLERLGLDERALEAYRIALDHDPTLVASYTNIGVLLHKHRKMDGAIHMLEHAISVDPEFSNAHLNLGSVHASLGDLEKTLHCYRKAVATDPVRRLAEYELVGLRYRISDWLNLERDTKECLAIVRRNKLSINPFNMSYMSTSLAEQHEQSIYYVKSIGGMEDKTFTEYKTAPFSKHSKEKRRLKVGFVSSDLKQHPVGFHLLELLEKFDRDRVETFGYCHSKDQDKEIQRNLRAAFDHFVPVKELGDLDVAQLIHDNEIDILINLNGYTAETRNRIFSYRPAPVQINYLGYPATMGAHYIDYIMADKTVVPMEHQPHYTESIVHLPDSYFPVDCRNRTINTTTTRTEHGLPEDEFVFCCFNASQKITPHMFDIWMRLLNKIEGSVLWLFEANELCKSNIQREIIARKIDPNRIIFAKKLDLMEDHQARCSLPDLFLDTLPFNAHATAADALCAGLPILTCLGEAFAGRVAASLLTAIDIPELITTSLEEYEAKALELANNPAKLQKIRDKLSQKLAAGPLFDGAKYARDMELTFEHMIHHQKEGKKPEPFALADLATT